KKPDRNTSPAASTARAGAGSAYAPLAPYRAAESTFPVGPSFARNMSTGPDATSVVPPMVALPWNEPATYTLPLASVCSEDGTSTGPSGHTDDRPPPPVQDAVLAHCASAGALPSRDALLRPPSPLPPCGGLHATRSVAALPIRRDLARLLAVR